MPIKTMPIKMIVLSLVVLIAIAGAVAAVPLGGRSGGQSENIEPSEYKTHDDLLLEIAKRIPEFGGMYLSDDRSILYVYVVDGAEGILDRQEVKDAIDEVLKAGLTDRRELRLVPAQFSMLQLHEWYNQIPGLVFGDANVVLTDLDEDANRIEIGVDSLDETETLEDSLASANIPRKAVIIQVRARPQVTSHSLQDRATGGSMEGGYQTTGARKCTLGFNVVRDGENGFVTAGHCTDPNTWHGGVDNTDFYQPSSGVNATAIGEETIDPEFSEDEPECDAGKVCRYSDAAFIQAASGLSQNFGKIAKPTAEGSIDVDHNSAYRIVQEGIASVGDTVNKVGRTTGLTSGNVVDTCVHTDLSGDRVLLCQTITHVHAENYDSGSPVFEITNSPNDDDVELLGIVWASNTNTDPTTMWYSTLGTIYLDLGMNVSWDACDPSHDC